MTRAQYFEQKWHERWFDALGFMKTNMIDRSSNDVQSMHSLVYAVIEDLEDALTIPKKKA